MDDNVLKMDRTQLFFVHFYFQYQIVFFQQKLRFKKKLEFFLKGSGRSFKPSEKLSKKKGFNQNKQVFFSKC